MKKFISFIVALLFLACICHAQENKPGTPIGGITVKGGKNPGGSWLLHAGGGFSGPGSAFKTNQAIMDGFTLNAGVYLPAVHRPSFSIGPNISAALYRFNGSGNNRPMYNISGQTSATAGEGNTSHATAFSLQAGVQANFSFGKFTLSPVLNAAFVNYPPQLFLFF